MEPSMLALHAVAPLHMSPKCLARLLAYQLISSDTAASALLLLVEGVQGWFGLAGIPITVLINTARQRSAWVTH